MNTETNEFAEQVKSMAEDFQKMFQIGYAAGYKAGVKDTSVKALDLVNKAFASKVQV